MQQWEYLYATAINDLPQNNVIVTFENGLEYKDPIEYLDYLNTKGSEGWELISENIDYEDIKTTEFHTEIINNYKIENNINLYTQKFNSGSLGGKIWKIVGVLQNNDNPGWTKMWIIIFSREIIERYIKRRIIFKRLKTT